MNFDPQEFRHIDEEPLDRLPPRIENIIPSIPNFSSSGSAYNRDNRNPSVYTENFAGFGSHGNHLPKSRSDPNRVSRGATSPKSIHLVYKLPSVDAPVPFHPYTDQHFDQQNLPRLVVRNESALANDYAGSRSSASFYEATPRGSLILDSRNDRDLPPLPPIPSQSGEVSPFADPRSEPAPSLGPRSKNVRHRSTNTVGFGNEDAYDGYS